jgi:hypothetical protein
MTMQNLRTKLRASAWPDGGLEREKEHVESYLVEVCDVLDTENRGPDDWEAWQVLAAVGAIGGHLYHFALTCIDLAMTPVEERADEWRGNAQGITRQQLEFAIEHVRQSAVPGG